MPHLRYLLFLLPLLCATLHAQRDTEHATTFGIGRANHLDTYLSPQDYKGPQISIMGETMRSLKRNPHISFQTITLGNISLVDNHTNNASEYGGDISYTVGWFHQWDNVLLKGLRLMAGGQACGDIGFLYNTRNGNNPAQAYLSAHLAASVAGIYKFNIRKQHLALRYQASLPLMGAMFSPAYGQSYYELFSLGHYDHNIRFTHPGNALSLFQQFSFDLPIRHSTLRLSYLSNIRQSEVNSIRQHHISRSFMIGYVRQLTIKR